MYQVFATFYKNLTVPTGFLIRHPDGDIYRTFIIKNNIFYLEV